MITRALQRLTARLGIAALLFAQLAVAAYACPTVLNPGEIAAVLTAADMHAAMPDCEESSGGNPNLCLQYLQADSQSVQTATQDPVPPAIVVAFAAPLRTGDGSGHLAPPALPVELARSTSPPPLLRFGFLRI